MRYPKEVSEIVQRCVDKYPDIETAYDKAESQIRALSAFKSFVDLLIRRGIQELICDARHTKDVAIRNKVRVYGGPAKVVVGKSKGVQEIESEMFSYRISGMELGAMKGVELEEFADGERGRANGHMFNSRLLMGCREHVSDEDTVRKSMSVQQLYNVWKKAEKGGGAKKK
jgi:hypothetical protein